MIVMSVYFTGLNNRVSLNGENIEDWTAYCLDFSADFMTK